jgi:predicted permease
MRLPHGIRRLFNLESGATAPQEDIRTELDFPLDMQTRELIGEGWTQEEARREAERRFGRVIRIESDLRQAHRSEPRRHIASLLNATRQDLGFALRTLSRTPGYTAVAVLTLGLGIGANTAMFTLVDGVLMRPLPYQDADRLVTLWSSSLSRGPYTRSPVSYPDFRDWRSQATSFEGMAMLYGHDVVLREREGPTPLLVAAVSGDYFELLRARAVLGRPFSQSGVSENPQVAVLKYGTWQRRFGGDPAIVGRTITLDDMIYTIVGVLDQGRDFPGWGEMWIPLSPEIIARHNLEHRGQRIDTWVLARLRPGVDSAAASAELQAIANRLAQAYPETNIEWSTLIAPLHQIVIDPWGTNASMPRSLLLLNGAVALVLLIACANVANLSMARVLHRRRELAIRTALGAGRWRLVRHLLTESLIVTATGATLGVVFARWAVSLILLRGPALPRAPEIAVDLRVLLFTAGLVGVTTLVFGILPAFRGAGTGFAELRDGPRGAIGGMSGKRLQSVLVTSQVGFALLLLTGAGLLIESLRSLQRVDAGFAVENLLVLRTQAQSPPYSTDEQLLDLHRRLEEAVENIPGVIAASTVNHVPGGGMVISRIEALGLDTSLSVTFRTAAADYIETMGIPVREGRSLTDADMIPWNGSILINERLASILGNALGRRVTVFKQKPGPDFGKPLEGTVIGIIGDVRGSLAQRVSPYTVYLPNTVNPWQSATLVVRTDQTVQNPAVLVREAVLRVDPNLPVIQLRMMEDQMYDSLAQQRFAVLLMGAFASAALLLAALGLYGVLAYLVRQRSREISVRMALGARQVDVVRLVVKRAMIIVGVGVVAGLTAATMLTRVMSSLLFDVSPTDPVTFLTVTGVLVCVAVVASYFPARRAASLDPMQVLRDG